MQLDPRMPTSKNPPEQFTGDYVPPLGSKSANEVPHVFVLCHNPVRKGDDEACGKAGTAPRLGDLRYNIVSVIQETQQSSPWGIMVDANDPLTGEKMEASINVWTHVNDLASQQLVD